MNKDEKRQTTNGRLSFLLAVFGQICKGYIVIPLSKRKKENKMNDIKMLHGIDSLYYFCESNENYDDLFLDIQDQVESIKGQFSKKEIEFENSDINIRINDIPLCHLGKAEGFYWFKDINNFFKIGFKDRLKNRGLNDIRVQLQAVGIYTIGIKSLLDFINDVLLRHYVTGFYPITRADLNCFIQYDFSFVTKNMFVTRKRKYSTISEIGSSTSTQTLYVGKEPFKLRLYNKLEELKKSSKKELMYEYFLNNEFDLEKPLFNIEFEMHRTHLRQYNIQTIEELLSNAENLFKDSMNQIKLVDLSNITDNDIKNNSKNRASVLPIWQQIQDAYTLEEFLQTTLPLQRIKRVVSIYDDSKFQLEYISLVRRAFINNLHIDTDYLELLFHKAKESLKKHKTLSSYKQSFTEVDIISPDGTTQKLRLLENGQLIEPLRTVPVSQLQDYDLMVYLDKVKEKQHLSQKHKDIYEVALKEAMNRNLIPQVCTYEAKE